MILTGIFLKTIPRLASIVAPMSSSLHWMIAAFLLVLDAGSRADAPPLRTVREIRALSAPELRAHPAVALRGVITD
jgi:hypothetical protein